mmetsp:Transcript_6888/g.11095  ORF Transcript_6888/g.11095 Transcript_6888/m.11095 type:complete len:80 (-) Transcript_6888:72-311(-)
MIRHDPPKPKRLQSACPKGSKCQTFNGIFSDVKTMTLAKPDPNDVNLAQYDHDPLVRLNDYTKNISGSVFCPGELPRKK